MNKLLERLSSYNLFNYLLPGAVFAVLVDEITNYSFLQDDLIAAFFVYYLAGLVISRIGSLIIEPLLKRSKFIEFAPYNDFVESAKKDPKLEVLSEANNTYRTLIALFVTVGIIKLFEIIVEILLLPVWVQTTVLSLSMMILFLYSYRKQTKYIKQRVERNKG